MIAYKRERGTKMGRHIDMMRLLLLLLLLILLLLLTESAREIERLRARLRLCKRESE